MLESGYQNVHAETCRPGFHSLSMPVMSLGNRLVGEKAICDPATTLFHCWGLYGLDAMVEVP